MKVLQALNPLADALRNYYRHGLRTQFYPENVERQIEFEKRKAELELAGFERQKKEWDDRHPSQKDPYWDNPNRGKPFGK